MCSCAVLAKEGGLASKQCLSSILGRHSFLKVILREQVGEEIAASGAIDSGGLTPVETILRGARKWERESNSVIHFGENFALGPLMSLGLSCLLCFGGFLCP